MNNLKIVLDLRVQLTFGRYAQSDDVLDRDVSQPIRQALIT
jgi:hypothetical protein